MTTELNEADQTAMSAEVADVVRNFQDELLLNYPQLSQATAVAIHGHLFAIQLLCALDSDRIADTLADFLKRNTCKGCRRRLHPSCN